MSEIKSMVILLVVTSGIMGALIFTSAYFEMQSFNKFSKVKASYWDALWVELRVIPQ